MFHSDHTIPGVKFKELNTDKAKVTKNQVFYNSPIINS